MPLDERIGLDELPDDQVIWRFLTPHKFNDLIDTNSLRLARISDLRKMDERESHLPAVVRETLRKVSPDEDTRIFVEKMSNSCEDQALAVFASCWFLPGTPEENRRMWEEFGGGNKGGIRIHSTIRRLVSSIPTDRLFGIGRIRYIRADITYPDTFALGQYFSAPFLLKLQDHSYEREIRLFERFHRPDAYWQLQEEQPPSTRLRITGADVIESITISPMCSNEIRRSITDQVEKWMVPKECYL